MGNQLIERNEHHDAGTAAKTTPSSGRKKAQNQNPTIAPSGSIFWTGMNKKASCGSRRRSMETDMPSGNVGVAMTATETRFMIASAAKRDAFVKLYGDDQGCGDRR
jgi:hypothetical protein